MATTTESRAIKPTCLFIVLLLAPLSPAWADDTIVSVGTRSDVNDMFIDDVVGTGPTYTLELQDDPPAWLAVGDTLMDAAVPSKGPYLVTAINVNNRVIVRDYLGTQGAPAEGNASSSRAYSTIVAAASGIPTFTDPGDTYEIHLFNDALITGSPVEIDDDDLGTAGHLIITVPPGERHDGTAGTGARWQPTDGEPSIALNIATNTPKQTIEWLEIIGPPFIGDPTDGIRIYHSNPTSGTTLRNLIIHDYANGDDHIVTGIHVAASNVDIINCLIYDISKGEQEEAEARGLWIASGAANCRVLNCTFDRCETTAIRTDHGGGGLARVANCAVFNSGADPFNAGSGSWSAHSDYNCTDATTAPGSNSLKSRSPAAQFVSITDGSEDYHLKTGADCLASGTDLSAIFTDDIDGDPRFTPWDIGADDQEPCPLLSTCDLSGTIWCVDLGVDTDRDGVVDGDRDDVGEDTWSNTSGAFVLHNGMALLRARQVGSLPFGWSAVLVGVLNVDKMRVWDGTGAFILGNNPAAPPAEITEYDFTTELASGNVDLFVEAVVLPSTVGPPPFFLDLKLELRDAGGQPQCSDTVRVAVIELSVTATPPAYLPENSNTVQFTATVLPAGLIVDKIVFLLPNVSNWPGHAMNEPAFPATDTDPDYRFVAPPGFDVTPDQLRATTTSPVTAATVTVTSFDFGGIAIIRANLQNHSSQINEQRIPLDTDGDTLPDAYENLQPDKDSSNPDTDGNGTWDADEDDDTQGPVSAAVPVGACPFSTHVCQEAADLGLFGDGLSAFEEYRGFFIQGVHTRTTTQSKDLFVVADASLEVGIGFTNALDDHGFSVHEILEGEMDSTANRVINWQRAGIPSVTSPPDQRALWVVRNDALLDPFFPFGVLLGLITTQFTDPLCTLSSPNEVISIEVNYQAHFPCDPADPGCNPPLDEPIPATYDVGLDGERCTDDDLFRPVTDTEAKDVLRQTIAHECAHGLHVEHDCWCEGAEPGNVTDGDLDRLRVLVPVPNTYTDSQAQQVRLHLKHP